MSNSISNQIEENLKAIREVLDKRTFSTMEHAEKLEELSSLLGLAAETRSLAIRFCASQERLAIDEKGLKGASVGKDVRRYTAFEGALQEYSDKLFEAVIESIGALRTLVSLAKKENI